MSKAVIITSFIESEIDITRHIEMTASSSAPTEDMTLRQLTV